MITYDVQMQNIEKNSKTLTSPDCQDPDLDILENANSCGINYNMKFRTRPLFALNLIQSQL